MTRITRAVLLAIPLLLAACSSGDASDSVAALDTQTTTTVEPTTTTTTIDVAQLLADTAEAFNTECTSRVDPGYYRGVPAIASRGSLDVDLNSGQTTPKCSGLLIDTLIDTFGFSDGIRSRIDGTRALDGELSATAPGWTIYWRYHPDDGLDVILVADQVAGGESAATTTSTDKPAWRLVGEMLSERSPEFAESYDSHPVAAVDGAVGLADQICDEAEAAVGRRALFDELNIMYVLGDQLQELFPTEEEWRDGAEIFMLWKCPEEHDRLYNG